MRTEHAKEYRQKLICLTENKVHDKMSIIYKKRKQVKIRLRKRKSGNKNGVSIILQQWSMPHINLLSQKANNQTKLELKGYRNKVG